MSNEITAYFKGRTGVAESVYQYDYGMVLVFDGIDLPATFDCYFSNEGDEEATPAIGADNRVAIPNNCLATPGNVTVHIPLQTGLNDSEVEYVVTVKVINRAKPVDDGTEADQTAISRAIAALNHNNLPGLVPDIVTDWLEDHPEATTTVLNKSISKAKLTDELADEIDSNTEAVEPPYYDEIISYKERNHDTDCYFSEVPLLDKNGDMIVLYPYYDSERNPLEQAQKYHTSLTVNGNATLDIGETVYRAGITISNGVVINSRSFYEYPNPNPMYIGIKADRSHVDYQMNTDITPAEMLADGCVQVFNCYFKLVENGTVTSLENRYWNDYVLTEADKDVLMLMGFKANKDIVFMACDGRSDVDAGLTARQGANLMIGKGCTDVYYLDGGGSSCLIVNESKYNRNMDGGGAKVRNGHYTLNVTKESTNIATEDAFSKISKEKQNLIEMLIPWINASALKAERVTYQYYTSLASFVSDMVAGTARFVVLSETVARAITDDTLTVAASGFVIRNSDNIDYILKASTYSYIEFGRYNITTGKCYTAWIEPTGRHESE